MKASQYLIRHQKGLYYFYIVAKHLSIKLAAEELYVTQAAVSQQVRQLEEALGVALFYRHHRALELTPEGQRLLPDLKVAFKSMLRSIHQVLERDDTRPMTISVLPSFASRWLIPRLGRFYQEHPHVAVNLSMTENLEDFDHHGVDLAIRFGKGQYEGIESRWLMTDYIYPVCHPQYLVAEKNLPAKAIRTISDLHGLRLLDDVASNLGWDYWLKRKGQWLQDKGFSIENFAERIRYDGSHYVIDSALSAQGIAMVRHSLVAESIQQGHLMRLFDEPVELEFQYFLCAPKNAFQRESVNIFSAWLEREVQRFKRRYIV